MTTENRRIAQNEALFRAANERKRAWPEERERAEAGAPIRFWCECAVEGCRRQIALTAAEYEAVRADPMHFVVIREHVFPEAEAIVAEHEGYVIVRKHEDTRDIVEGTDPRRHRWHRRHRAS